MRPSESVFDAIAEGFGISRRIDEVALGGEAIENGESFADHGIEDGARLTVSFCARATVVEVDPGFSNPLAACKDGVEYRR